ncbi:hypothetical protein SK128_019954, partial [Halocaridina rubra]
MCVHFYFYYCFSAITTDFYAPGLSPGNVRTSTTRNELERVDYNFSVIDNVVSGTENDLGRVRPGWRYEKGRQWTTKEEEEERRSWGEDSHVGPWDDNHQGPWTRVDVDENLQIDEETRWGTKNIGSNGSDEDREHPWGRKNGASPWRIDEDKKWIVEEERYFGRNKSESGRVGTKFRGTTARTYTATNENDVEYSGRDLGDTRDKDILYEGSENGFPLPSEWTPGGESDDRRSTAVGVTSKTPGPLKPGGGIGEKNWEVFKRNFSQITTKITPTFGKDNKLEEGSGNDFYPGRQKIPGDIEWNQIDRGRDKYPHPVEETDRNALTPNIVEEETSWTIEENVNWGKNGGKLWGIDEEETYKVEEEISSSRDDDRKNLVTVRERTNTSTIQG